jgi:hypothetical protein
VSVELLHRGACEVVLAPALDAAALSGEVEASIAEAWDAACVRRPGLFDGPLLSAVKLSGDRLFVRPSQYRHFVAQRNQPDLVRHLNVSPVAVSGLVITRDGRWLFGQRGADVTQYPLHLEAVPSGTLDQRAFAGHAREPGLVLDPVSCLLAELSEEAGIEAEVVGQVTPLGLLLDVQERTYDLAYLVELVQTAAELRGRMAAAEASLEYQQLRALDAGEVAAAMAEAAVTPTTRLLWDLGRAHPSVG